MRVIAYGLILIAIIDQNRAGPALPDEPAVPDVPRSVLT